MLSHRHAGHDELCAAIQRKADGCEWPTDAETVAGVVRALGNLYVWTTATDYFNFTRQQLDELEAWWLAAAKGPLPHSAILQDERVLIVGAQLAPLVQEFGPRTVLAALWNACEEFDHAKGEELLTWWRDWQREVGQ